MVAEQTFEGRKMALDQANKLSRTYTILLEALNRHRGKGPAEGHRLARPRWRSGRHPTGGCKSEEAAMGTEHAPSRHAVGSPGQGSARRVLRRCLRAATAHAGLCTISRGQPHRLPFTLTTLLGPSSGGVVSIGGLVCRAPTDMEPMSFGE